MSATAVNERSVALTAAALRDVQPAADVLRPVHDRTSGADGYGSWEVAPRRAH